MLLPVRIETISQCRTALSTGLRLGCKATQFSPRNSSSMDYMMALNVVCPMYRRFAAAVVDLHFAISRN